MELNSIKIHNFTLGVVLAGGKSSRMGENKALLNNNGVRLVDHMSAILFALKPPIKGIIVSGTVPGTSCMPDQYHELGPVGGIATIMQNIRRDIFSYLLIIPVDMPLLKESMLEKLIYKMSVHPYIEAIHFKGFELPLLIKISNPLTNFINMAIETPSRRSIRWLINQLTKVELETTEDEPKCFVNINTMDEWKSFSNSEREIEYSNI